MRKAKTCLMILFVVSLVASWPVGVFAQSDDDQASVLVTGEVIFPTGDVAIAGSSVSRGGVLEIRGRVGVGELTMSDPRLSGTQAATFNRDEYGAVTATARSMLVENDEGSWQGTYRGMNDVATGRANHQALLTGQGSYNGLSAILFYDGTVSDGFSVSGSIFPGELPDYPDASGT